MTLLLETYAYLWVIGENSQLPQWVSEKKRKAFVSIDSSLEIATKMQRD